MNESTTKLNDKLSELIEQWQKYGLPSRYEIESIASELKSWKQAHDIPGLWPQSPSMITATLDDALGKGIEIIQMYAEVAGIKILPLGIMQSPETIVNECKKHLPSLLGLTVLRSYAYEDLEYIGNNIPASTLLIVGGGPFLKSNPDMVLHANIHRVLEDVGAFLQFVINFEPSQRP